MERIKKTYRLLPDTVDQIDILKKHYAKNGFNLSNTQIVQKAIDSHLHEVYQRQIEQDVKGNKKG